MDKKRKKITACCTMHVKSCCKISENIIEIVFILPRDYSVEIGMLGLGPHAKVLFPGNETHELQFPTLNSQGKIEWPDIHQPIVRHYSVKQYDPHTNEITLYFVNPNVGIGSRWARNAKPGDEVGLITLSAKCHYDNQYLVLLGDRTLLGSVQYVLAHLPDTAQGQVYLWVMDENDIQPLPKLARFQIHWIVKKDPHSLIDALERNKFPQIDSLLFWGGMEREAAKSIKSYLTSRFNLNQENCQLIPYWQFGKCEGEFSRREGE